MLLLVTASNSGQHVIREDKRDQAQLVVRTCSELKILSCPLVGRRSPGCCTERNKVKSQNSRRHHPFFTLDKPESLKPFMCVMPFRLDLSC